jgi:NTP pyrophosphatase (non-canonical NTP hydrolase)
VSDASTTLAELKALMARFVTERDWDQFHSPKGLSMSLSCEAAELMEHFLWMENSESRRIVEDPAKLGEVADEIADVALHLLALGNTLGIDLSDAIRNKLVKAAQKYPAEKYRGRYDKAK